MRTAPVNFASVKVEGTFWRERLETLATKTIPAIYAQLETNGILDALNAKTPADPKIPLDDKGFTPQMVWDADVARWLEAASYSLVFRRDATIEAQINAIAEQLAKAQQPDGYLNSWFGPREPEKRWTNLRDHRELFAAGHLIEAAVAHFQSTGEQALIDVALKYVDHIMATFGRSEDQKHGYDAHQEIELALIRLYGVTKNEDHLELASYFIDERGQTPVYFDIEAVTRGDETRDIVGRTYEYQQAHRRVRSQDKAVGRAVGAMNMYAAMACLAADRNDASLKRAVDALWQDMTGKQMYVTGGIGQERAGDAFGEPYDLPNETAGAETSAAVGLVLWAKRMLALELNGKFTDVLELALYNGALAGLSHDGTHFFHANPLASDWNHRRWSWENNPAAATNIARLIAAVGGLFYATTEDGLAVHLYGGAAATMNVGGRAVSVKETSNYPWSGKINIAIDPVAPGEFTVRLRIPAFATGATAKINGAGIDVAGSIRDGYLEIRRTWNPGDVVDLDLPLRPERLYAHALVKADLGRTAIRRGPLIYCFEGVDNPAAPPSQIRLPKDATMTGRDRPDIFGGIVSIAVEGKVPSTIGWGGELYRTSQPPGKPMLWTAIPYYLWANREPSEMAVWVMED